MPISMRCSWPHRVSCLRTQLSVDFAYTNECVHDIKQISSHARCAEQTPFEFVHTFGSLRGMVSRPYLQRLLYHFKRYADGQSVPSSIQNTCTARLTVEATDYVNRFPLYLRQRLGKAAVYLVPENPPDFVGKAPQRRTGRVGLYVDLERSFGTQRTSNDKLLCLWKVPVRRAGIV